MPWAFRGTQIALDYSLNHCVVINVLSVNTLLLFSFRPNIWLCDMMVQRSDSTTTSTYTAPANCVHPHHIAFCFVPFFLSSALLCLGVTSDRNPRFQHGDFTPHQENLFLLFLVRFLPLLRHMVVILGLWVHAATMLRDPWFAPKLTTVVGTWQETCTTRHSLSRSRVTRRAHCGRLSMCSILSIHSNAQSPWRLLVSRGLGYLKLGRLVLTTPSWWYKLTNRQQDMPARHKETSAHHTRIEDLGKIIAHVSQ